MAKGKVTFNDSIDEKVFEIGKIYNKSLDPAIQANNEWLDSFKPIKEVILELDKLQKNFKQVKTPKDFTEQKKKFVKVIDLETVAINENNKSLNNLNRIKERNKRATNDVEKAIIKERVQLQAKNKITKQAVRVELGMVGAYEKLNKRRTEAKKKLADLLSAEKVNTQQVKKAQIEYQKLNKRVLAVDKVTNNYTKNIGNYKSAFSGAISVTRQLTSALGLMGGAFAVVSVFRNAFNSIKSFDASMQNLAGIARVTRKDMGDLEQTIIDVASDSVRTATDVAKLAESLTTLGKSKEEVKQLLQPVNDLSLALGSSSAETGEFLVQMLNTFGKSTASAGEFADTIATIRTSTSLNFQKIRDSFQYLAPISNLLNKDLAYTGALVGILADNGIKAERAGRLLGTAQQKLAKQGLTLNDALNQVNEASKNGADEIELLAVASDLFGKQASSLGVILANNSSLIDTNAESIRNNKGALKDLVDQQLLSLSAHLDILKSKWESYILNTDKATGSSNQLKKGIKFLSDNLEAIIRTLIFIIKTWVVYKTVVKLASIQTSLISKKIAITTAVSEANAVGVSTMSLAWSKFSKVLKANAIGIIITVLSGAILLFNKFNKTVSETVQELGKSTDEFLKSKKTIEDNNKELSKLISRHDELKSKTKLSTDEQIELNKIIKKIAKNVPDAVTEIDKYGDAMVINTDKAKEFVKLQNDVLALRASEELKKQKKVLKDLKDELESYNAVNETGNNIYVKGFGLIKKQGDSFIKVSNVISKTGNIRITETELTDAQTLAYKNQQLEIEKNIIAVKKRISALDGTAKAEAEAKKETEAKTKAEAEAEAKAKKIAKLRKERNAKRIARNKVLEEKLKTSAFNLAKFRLETEIKLQDDLFKNEEKGDNVRFDALQNRSFKEIELAVLIKNRKLENVKKGTDEEKLILEQFEQEKKNIQNRTDKSSDTLEIDIIKRNAEIKKNIAIKAMNDEITAKKDLLKLALQDENLTAEKRKKLIEDTESEIAKIKNKYAIKGLNDQLKALNELISQTKKGSALRAQYEAEASKLKNKISDLELNVFKEKEDGKTEAVKISTEEILQTSQDLTNAIGDLANALFDAKIQNIDNEIQKNEDYYNRQIKLAGNNEAQKQLLQEESYKKREELEKKKRKEQRKQAILDKAIAIAQIGIYTALSIVKASPDVFKITAAAILGAIQLATAIATPIPKYAKGTDNHFGGLALVGEERAEVITEPNKTPYIVNSPSVLDLPKGTKVTPSLEEYDRMMNHSLMDSIKLNQLSIDNYNQIENKELVSLMKENNKLLKRKQNTFVRVDVDIEHAIWRNNNIDW